MTKKIKTEIPAAKPPKLWTKDFTILTLGSFVSMFGNAACGFAFAMLVFDNTQSTFLSALMMAANLLPGIIFPTIAGAFFDRRSRRKAIYILDFISAGLFFLIAMMQHFQIFYYLAYLAFTFVIGIISAYYMVAFDSYFPNVIAKGNYSKSYSINSLLYPIATVVSMPVVGFVYSSIGIAPLFAFSAAMFFVTAIFELFIRAPEPHLIKSKEELARKTKVSAFKQFSEDLKYGFKYLNGEKGLLTISMYFFFTMGTGAVLSSLFLPFVKRTFIEVTEVRFLFFSLVLDASVIYAIIMGANTLGRLAGGLAHYAVKIPAKYKFNIAMTVYVSITILDMFVLVMPDWRLMCVLQIVSGLLAVNSFNIRISSTQNYVPDSVRARYNGVFAFITMLGTVIGQLTGGALGEYFDARYIVFVAMAINLISIFVIMYTNRVHVKKIYNIEQF